MDKFISLITSMLKQNYVVHMTNDTVDGSLLARIQILAIPEMPHIAALFVSTCADGSFMLAVQPWDVYNNEGFGDPITNFFEEEWGGTVMGCGNVPMMEVDAANIESVISKALDKAKHLKYRYENNKCHIFVE